MSDNVIITQGTGTAIAAENIAGAYIQRIKLALGDLDSDAGDVALDNPMPIIVTGGTVNINSLPSIVISGGNIVVSGTVNQTGSVTSSGTTNIGNIVVISGTTNIGNIPSVNIVGGTVNLSGTVSITGGTVSASFPTGIVTVNGTTTGSSVIISGTTGGNPVLVGGSLSITGGNIVVSGTVNTTGSLSGTVAISGGTVNINAMPTVVVSGTVNTTSTATLSGGTVNIGNIPTVIISGTVSVGTNTVVLNGGTSNTCWNQIVGNTVSTSVGATGTGVQRVVLADNMGRTLLSVSGTTNTAVNNNTIIPLSAANKNKIYAFSLTTLQNASSANCIFTDGTNGTPIWQVVLQAISGSISGANLAVTPPGFLFANSGTNTPILLQITGGTANPVAYSVSYFQDAT